MKLEEILWTAEAIQDGMGTTISNAFVRIDSFNWRNGKASLVLQISQTDQFELNTALTVNAGWNGTVDINTDRIVQVVENKVNGLQRSF